MSEISNHLRRRLAIIEAQLFGATDGAVLDAIDSSLDLPTASARLQALGLTGDQADAVLTMPMGDRTIQVREDRVREAEDLRSRIEG